MVPLWVEGGGFATYEAEEERRQPVEARKLVTNTSRYFTRCTQDMIPAVLNNRQRPITPAASEGKVKQTLAT